MRIFDKQETYTSYMVLIIRLFGFQNFFTRVKRT